MEGDQQPAGASGGIVLFQSTPSAWRETGISFILFTILSNISIHSLRMEGDPELCLARVRIRKFQSTPSAWRETVTIPNTITSIGISIHSLRMEGDPTQSPALESKFRISIHSLRMEGDLRRRCDVLEIIGFQSTPSAWRETFVARIQSDIHTIFQSTPSAWRETNTGITFRITEFYFNPLPPHGGRPNDGWRLSR